VETLSLTKVAESRVRLTTAQAAKEGSPYVWAGSTIADVPQGRPAIPSELKRRVQMEAGHRCAIPTCRSVPIELAHIVPWERVRAHTFENLIALCPTCHARFDRGDIDRLSMSGYKANLAVVASRYGDFERRVLDILTENPTAEGILLPGGREIDLLYLLKDGLLIKARPDSVLIDGLPAHEDYVLTAAGRRFLAHWAHAEPVSAEAECLHEDTVEQSNGYLVCTACGMVQPTDW
jgi:hypothetical protein